MKLSKRWNRIFSVVITAILVASLLITYPAFNVTKANNTVIPSGEMVYNETLAKIYIDTNNASVARDEKEFEEIVVAYYANNNVSYFIKTDGSYELKSVNDTGRLLRIVAKYDIIVNISSTDKIFVGKSPNELENTNTVQFSLKQGEHKDIYFDVSSIDKPSFGVITLAFVNETDGYKEVHNIYVYVTEPVTSEKIKVYSDETQQQEDLNISAEEIEDLNVTWDSFAVDGVTEYMVIIERDGEQITAFNTTDKWVNYTVLSSKIELTDGEYTVHVFPFYGGNWNVWGMGGNVTFAIDTVPPTIEPIPDKSDYFTGHNDPASEGSWNITLVYLVDGTYTNVSEALEDAYPEVYIVNSSDPDDVWKEGADPASGDYNITDYWWNLTGTNLYELWINITVYNGTEGVYKVFINVTDAAGNSFNTSEDPDPEHIVYIVVDNTIPSVKLSVMNLTTSDGIYVGAAHVRVTITDNYQAYGSINLTSIKINRTDDADNNVTIVEYNSTSGEFEPKDPLVVVHVYEITTEEVVVEFYDFNVTTNGTAKYWINVSDYAGNYNDTVTNETTIKDTKNPVVSKVPIVRVPVGMHDVYMNLTDYLPVSKSDGETTEVSFLFEVSDEHIQYFNVSFDIFAHVAEVNITFLQDPTYDMDYDWTHRDSMFVTVKDVYVERYGSLRDFKYYVYVNITIDESALDLGMVYVSWHAKDFALNDGSSATGYKIYYLSYQIIDIYNLTATSKAGGDVLLTWEINGTGNYSGFLVYASIDENSWTLVYNGLGSTATSVNIDNSTLEEKLGLEYGVDEKLVYFMVCAITHDAHQDYDTNSTYYDSKPPTVEVTNCTDFDKVTEQAKNMTIDKVYTDGDSIYINFSITDVQGVDWGNITFDASAVNATEPTWTYNKTEGWLNVTITFDNGANGEYNITMYVKDLVGNELEYNITVYVDNEPPKAVLINAPKNETAGSAITIQVNITDWPSLPVAYNLTIGDQYVYNDTLSDYVEECVVDGNKTYYWNGTITIQLPKVAGTYDIVIFVEDAVGNNATLTIGTIEVYAGKPASIKINLVELNGKKTEFTPGEEKYVVFVGDKFTLRALIYDELDNVISPENLKFKWKIILSNESGTVKALEIPEVGDWAKFEAITYGPVVIEAHLISYTDPLTGNVTELEEGNVSATVTLIIVPEVNKVEFVEPPTVVTVNETTALKIVAYYTETEGNFVDYYGGEEYEVEVPYAPLTLETVYGTLASYEVITGTDGSVTVNYTAPKFIGESMVNETVTVYYAGTELDDLTFKIRAGPAEKLAVDYTPEKGLVTEEITLTICFYDEFGNLAYGTYTVSIEASENLIVPEEATYENEEAIVEVWPIEAGTAWINVTYEE